MEIEFDPDKDQENQRKHALSLAEAARMDLDTALIREDTRHDYGERRFKALGLIDGRLHALIFTVRGRHVRVISLRRSNQKEQADYDA